MMQKMNVYLVVGWYRQWKLWIRLYKQTLPEVFKFTIPNCYRQSPYASIMGIYGLWHIFIA